MNEIRVKIGEHNFDIINYSPLLYDFFEENFIKMNENENTDIHMKIDIMSGFGIPFLNYEVKTASITNTLIFERADYLIEVDKEYTYANIKVHNELALKHALMNLYSCFIVHKNWGILLHSSCVIDRNKAHIFSGNSGAGKSTAAKLSHPRSLLADEASIIKLSNDEIIVYDSPFRSELTSKSIDNTYSLDSIQLLHQSPINNRTKLSKSNSLLQLFDKVFYWTYDSEETKKILVLLTILVTEVPVYNLYFQKNDSFWEMIS